MLPVVVAACDVIGLGFGQQDWRLLPVANIAPIRDLSDDRTVVSLNAILGKESVRQALEKANDTAPCFALREVKYVLRQRQRPKTTINQLWRIIEQ